MTKKYVTKTITEFVYDKDGRIIKKTETVENYEEEIEEEKLIEESTQESLEKANEVYKKSVGVPYTPPTIQPCTTPSFPFGTQIYCDTTKIGTPTAESLAESLSEQVKNALKNTNPKTSV
ncbi:MAG TPA: hypothetical protein VKU94_06355 [Geobacterales bacterium]|nr:hypothetical protein [Geobacterales bacterium]